MPSNIILYGHDKSDDGFANADELQAYIAQIFTKYSGRYLSSFLLHAKTIVLAIDGFACGHFEIEEEQKPTPTDKRRYSKTRKAYVVSRAIVYRRAVKLSPDIFRKKYQYGAEMTEDEFQKLQQAAGKPTRYTADDAWMPNKYCRICWNENGWLRPSRSAKESGESYVALHGFGHEEWLFNYEWCLGGFKYGFLQPIHRYPHAYEGKTCNMAMYAKHGGRSFLVATIREVCILSDEDRRRFFREMVARGWLEQMRTDVKAVRGDLGELSDPTPDLVVNVCFRPENVRRFFPMPVFPENHDVVAARRYQPVDWPEGEALPTLAYVPHKDRNRSGLPHLRAAQQAKTVDPKHQRLQDQLLAALRKKYGKDNVEDEYDGVDMRRHDESGQIFYEIKMDTDAKMCIRNAMGQLFEYAMFPAELKAHTWVVVGNAPPTEEDECYLAHIRKRFQVPLYYGWFNSEKQILEDPV